MAGCPTGPAQRLHEQLTRRLEGLEVVALFIDGVVVAQQTVIVALGITRDGTKVPLGLRLGSTRTPWCAPSCCKTCWPGASQRLVVAC